MHNTPSPTLPSLAHTLQARLMSSAMRKLCGSLSKGNTTMIFLNQIRMKVGNTVWIRDLRGVERGTL